MCYESHLIATPDKHVYLYYYDCSIFHETYLIIL
jgi:hypothetical protein